MAAATGTVGAAAKSLMQALCTNNETLLSMHMHTYIYSSSYTYALAQLALTDLFPQ